MVTELQTEYISLGEYMAYLLQRTSYNTAVTYISAMQEYNSWLDGRIPTRQTAQAFLDTVQDSGRSANTIAVKANAIRRWFKWKGNPISLDARPPHIPAPEYVTEEELGRLITACRSPLEKAILIGLFDTGCRISEWINIKTTDINWQEGLIKVTRKGGRETWVNASSHALNALEEWLNVRKSASELVFLGMTRQCAWGVIRQVGQRIGIELHPHMLRHSRAVQMLIAGADMHTTQQHLGHTSINTTMNIYSQLKPNDLKSLIPDWGNKAS